MGYYDWDFSKLPDNEWPKVLEAHGDNDFQSLILIHDRYELSKNSYCCGAGVPKMVMDWFEWGISNKQKSGNG